MRRKDREMNEDFALSVADKCAFATLAAVTAEGNPYCVPLTIARIGRGIYFHCAMEGTKVDVLRNNPKVSLCCVGFVRAYPSKFTTEYESAIICGTAREVFDAEEKIAALRAICERHTPENMGDFDNAVERSINRTAIWRIDIESITGKRKKYDAEGKEMKFGRME